MSNRNRIVLVASVGYRFFAIVHTSLFHREVQNNKKSKNNNFKQVLSCPIFILEVRFYSPGHLDINTGHW